MRQFDEMLRRELMEANLDDLESVLDNLSGWEPDLSPRYLRERTRLLADPRGWMRRRERPMWKRVVRSAACAALTCAVALGTLMAVSPTVRAAVSTWLGRIVRDEDSVKIVYGAAEPEEPVHPLPWRITWLPEGWAVESFSASGRSGVWSFCVTGDGGLIDQMLDFTYAAPGTGDMSFSTSDTGFDARRRTEVHGCPADCYGGAGTGMLVWEEADSALLTMALSPQTDGTLLKRAAESTLPWGGTPVEYTAGWAPEGYEEAAHTFSDGLGDWVWIQNHTPLELLYINEPICPFRVPDRASEAVTVNGQPALFWPGIFTKAEWDARIAEEDAPSTLMGCDLQACAVLTWEDPETNTSFRISGIAEKEDLLRMAENVART